MIDSIKYYYRLWYRRLLMSWEEKRCCRCLTTGCESKYSSDYNYLRKLDDSKTYMCDDCEYISMVN